MKALFAEVLAVPVEDDGVVFRPDEIRVETIREDVEYGGVRLKRHTDRPSRGPDGSLLHGAQQDRSRSGRPSRQIWKAPRPC
jgi:hypothetical protein